MLLFTLTDNTLLDKIIKFSIKNKLIIGLMTLFLILWGIWSVSRLPIDALPDITNNQVQILTTSPTLAAQEVETFITYPIEQAVKSIPRVVELRSISRFGLSNITVVFDEEVDIYWARAQISERLAEAKENIPDGLGTPEMAPSVQALVKFINTRFLQNPDLKINTTPWNFGRFRIGSSNLRSWGWQGWLRSIHLAGNSNSMRSRSNRINSGA